MLAFVSTRLIPDRPHERDGAHAACPYGELRSLTRAIGHAYEASFVEVGLTAKQHRLLSEIKRLQAVRSVDLARALGLDPSTVSRNLKPLLAMGWIRIEEGRDARTHRVRLTESGLERHALGERQWHVAKARVVQALGTRRVARLHALVEECLSALTLQPPDVEDRDPCHAFATADAGYSPHP